MDIPLKSKSMMLLALTDLERFAITVYRIGAWVGGLSTFTLYYFFLVFSMPRGSGTGHGFKKGCGDKLVNNGSTIIYLMDIVQEP